MFTNALRPATLLVALTVLVGSTATNLPASFRQGDKKTITVKNTTKIDIDELYISPDNEDHWGNDLMGSHEILHPGEEMDVEVDYGKWDVKLVDQNEKECKVEDITLCSADQWDIVADCN